MGLSKSLGTGLVISDYNLPQNVVVCYTLDTIVLRVNIIELKCMAVPGIATECNFETELV